MSKRAIIPLVIGLGVGLFALKLGLDVVKKAQGTQAAPATKQVVVAKAPISRESAITAEQIEVVDWPAALVPSGSFSDPTAVIDRVASVSLVNGMFISEVVLRPPGAKAGLEATIPSGYRAVAVKTDEYSAVGHWLTPGAHVDVLVVMNSHSRNRGSSSRVILRNIEVLAVGQVLDTNNKPGVISSRSITVLVRDQDAPKLHLASSQGKIRFALRGQTTDPLTDETLVKSDESDLYGEGPTTEAPNAQSTPVTTWNPTPVQNRTWTVEVLSGQSKVKRYEFAGPTSSRRVSGDANRPSVGTRHDPQAAARNAGARNTLASPLRSGRRGARMTGTSQGTPAEEREPKSLWGKVFDVNGDASPESEWVGDEADTDGTSVTPVHEPE
jgi:pilus assembly protein CpaB